jgi:hypothetical protein
MRASDVNIIPANYLRQENILTIVSSFFQDIHDRLRSSSQPFAVASTSDGSILQERADPTPGKTPSRERITVSSQVDSSANGPEG